MNRKEEIAVWGSVIFMISGLMFMAYSFTNADARSDPNKSNGMNIEDDVIIINGLKYEDCVDWDSCDIMIDDVRINCKLTSIYQAYTNPVCIHIILNHELDRRGL